MTQSVEDRSRVPILPDVGGTQAAAPSTARKIWKAISPRRVSAIYLAAILFAYFTYRLPDLFLEPRTWTTLLSQQSIAVIVALGVLIPVAAGVFDVSVAYTMGLTSTVMTLLIVEHNTPWGLAAVLVIVIGAVAGLVNAFVISILKVNSLIATLGTGMVIAAIDLALSSGESRPILNTSFTDLGTNRFLQLTWPVYAALAVAAITWYLLEHTAPGRRTYAIGGSAPAARLAGIPVRRYIAVTLMCAGVLGAVAGILLTARIGANTPGVGQSYVLPGFAAVFLGATQFKDGRMNAWGTVVAILALAVGTKGFDLIGVKLWIHDLFYGVALIVAMAMSVWSKRSSIEPNGLP